MIPLHLIVNKTRAKVDIRSRMWNRLITATGQPRLNGDDDEEATASSDDSNSPSRKGADSRDSATENSETGGLSEETGFSEEAGLSEESLQTVPSAQKDTQ